MISPKKVAELRKAWGRYSIMSNITVSKRVLVDLHDTLQALWRVARCAVELSRADQAGFLTADKYEEILIELDKALSALKGGRE